MSIKIPKCKEGGEWCGKDGFITHIDVVGVDRYSVCFQPDRVKGRKLLFAPNVVHVDHCVTVEMDGKTLARILNGETVSIDCQATSNSQTVYVVVSGYDEDYDIECVMSDPRMAKKYCDIKNITLESSYCRVWPYVVDGITVEDEPVMQASYHFKSSGDISEKITYCEAYEHDKSFMESDDVFVCTIDFDSDRSVMEDAVCKKFEEYKAARGDV
jgi:hypothetical protein